MSQQNQQFIIVCTNSGGDYFYQANSAMKFRFFEERATRYQSEAEAYNALPFAKAFVKRDQRKLVTVRAI